MNKFILKELNKLRVPTSEWDKNSSKIIVNRFKQFNTGLTDLQLGQTYDVRVENYIVNPPPSFTLAANWNKGTSPPETLMRITILQVAGKMIKCNCVGKNTNIQWEGWLPRKSIEIL